MEWLEVTGKTVADAKDRALDKLGVDDAEAEFEILEEPRQGLFGRTRGEARVRARVRPVTPRPKEDRNRRRRRGKGGNDRTSKGSDRKSSDRGSAKQGSAKQGNTKQGNTKQGNADKSNAGTATESRSRNVSNENKRPSDGGRRSGQDRNAHGDSAEHDASIDEVAATVEGFLVGLTAAFGLDAPVEVSTDNDEVVGQVQGKHGLLLGPKARTLDAIQELTRITSQRATPSNIRIKVDVGGYREGRRQALIGFAGQAADRAIADDLEVVLEPMSSADRKIVHDALADRVGVTTRSAGADPRRRVIVVPDSAGGASDEAAPSDAASSDTAPSGSAESDDAHVDADA